ncbi:alanine racemase [Variovorax sp. YR216]|uniref:alanine racemase n=1 Tax=Variovorax sp. YR216 TaxID=1882828 RepID=UPI00089C4633|nr:alanine racemase [Variovorax sp. YR216]SEB24808.1 alanine racemase [Variovorax sp. YR216]
MSRRPDTASAVLTIDLAAIVSNWRLLKARVGRADCAAVVKADAYGLGAARVGPALAAAGCRHFFVAHLEEAVALKRHLPADASVFVLHGPTPGSEAEFVAHGVLPVLNSRPQIDAWRRLAHVLDRALAAIVQVDSGMARLGLDAHELRAVAADRQSLLGVRVAYVMSHLACAENQGHSANAAQRERFIAARRMLPMAPATLANSSGIFLGPDHHFDLVRPGAALYGVAPVTGAPNPMRPVVRLEGRVIQTREIAAGTPVGYGHAWQCGRPARIATVSVGYADGWLRGMGNRASAWFGGTELPLVGRVSMDTITLDASALPEHALVPGSMVELIGERQGVDAVAARCDTIGYEILTSLGGRYARSYVD